MTTTSRPTKPHVAPRFATSLGQSPCSDAGLYDNSETHFTRTSYLQTAQATRAPHKLHRFRIFRQWTEAVKSKLAYAWRVGTGTSFTLIVQLEGSTHLPQLVDATCPIDYRADLRKHSQEPNGSIYGVISLSFLESRIPELRDMIQHSKGTGVSTVRLYWAKSTALGSVEYSVKQEYAPNSEQRNMLPARRLDIRCLIVEQIEKNYQMVNGGVGFEEPRSKRLEHGTYRHQESNQSMLFKSPKIPCNQSNM